NIEHELLRRSCSYERSSMRRYYNWLEYRLLKPVELARCRRASAISVTSEREQALLRSLVPEVPIEVVPNGVDTASFHPSATHEPEVARRLVFTGTYAYRPNVDAVLSFARECWPRIRACLPDATWDIVGSAPPPNVLALAALPGMRVTGAVPDVRPYLAGAAVAVVPIRFGGGTRLKVLEALAMGKAVVSTSLGCEGLALKSGTHLVVEDDPEAFASEVVR